MKNQFVRLCCLLSIFGLATIATYKYSHRESMWWTWSTGIDTVPSLRIDAIPPLWKTDLSSFPQTTGKVVVKRPKIRGDIRSFLAHMGKIEGLGSYNTISKSGYLGLYQFHPRTLRLMGVTVSKEEFLENPELQDSVMLMWMRDNARSLRGLIKKYHGVEYNGVYVTKAGILAGAHLVGPGGVLAFFYPEQYNFRTYDGNGVHVSEYMKRFAHYDLRGL
jgi:hypothetical protein